MKYTVSQARINFRKLLNECDRGEEVIIERYGEEYVLLARMGADTVKKYFERRPLTQQDVTTVGKELGASISIARDSRSACKIHATPLDARGRCLQKGCKFA